jgi:hypothetical protein
VTDHEHVILRGHEVGLDVVGAQPCTDAVGGKRVLGPVAGSAAMPIDRGLIRGLIAVVREREVDHRQRQQGSRGQQQQGASAEREHGRHLSAPTTTWR